MSTPASAESASPSNRRKQIIINPKMQWKIAGGIMLSVFGICAFAGVVLYGLLEQNARSRILHPEIDQTAQLVFTIALFGGIFATLTAGAFGLWSMLITHRFCGPLFLVGKYLSQISAGHLPDLRSLRKNDGFRDFYDQFRRAIFSMKKQRQSDLAALNQVQELLRQIELGNDQARTAAVKSAVEQVWDLRFEMATSLGEETPEKPSAANPQPESKSVKS